MKTSPALSVASLLFAFPVAAKVVEIGGTGARERARRGERMLYVRGAAAHVVDDEGRVLGRIVPEGSAESGRYALMDAGGAVVARSGESATAAPAEMRHAHWVLGRGALDIRGPESPIVLMTSEKNAASLRR